MTNDDFERELRGALARKQPPAGFAERVVARTAPQARPPRRWLPMAVAAVLIGFGGLGLQRWEEQRRGDEAKRQLLLALQITSEKLAFVEKALDRSTH